MQKEREISAPHTALYRKYRSRSLDEVVGQEHVIKVLKGSLKQGKIAHAYLLSGPRGVGKTSIARILAHEINKLPYDSEAMNLDIIEIDAASNNGVDNVRELRDRAQVAPAYAAKKIYIIDEVHMLSKQAFNALLKTLEEPPRHVVFILATTDPQKIPATIISRTQQFTFHAISPKDIVSHLKKISANEGIKISDDALETIALRGDGSFRDSISLLDQLSSFASADETITLEFVQSALGQASPETVSQLLKAVHDRDVAAVVSQLDELEKLGIQPIAFTDQVIKAIRDKLIEEPHLVGLIDSLINVSTSPQPQLKLLTALVGACKPKSAPAIATRQPKTVPTVIEAPVIVVEKPTPKKHAVADTEIKAAAVAAEPKHDNDIEEQIAAAKLRSQKSIPFEWDKLVAHTKDNFLALHSVLSKCDYEFDGNILTIYAIRKFNKTKLDQAKYLTQLQESLEACGQSNTEVHTLPIAKLPSDEKLAKVAAMMGGGHEISLEDEASKS